MKKIYYCLSALFILVSCGETDKKTVSALKKDLPAQATQPVVQNPQPLLLTDTNAVAEETDAQPKKTADANQTKRASRYTIQRDKYKLELPIVRVQDGNSIDLNVCYLKSERTKRDCAIEQRPIHHSVEVDQTLLENIQQGTKTPRLKFRLDWSDSNFCRYRHPDRYRYSGPESVNLYWLNTASENSRSKVAELGRGNIEYTFDIDNGQITLDPNGEMRFSTFFQFGGPDYIFSNLRIYALDCQMELSEVSIDFY